MPTERKVDMKRERGQSFIELSLVLVFLALLVAGVIEFGFLLNNYLNLVDASREAVRFSSNFDPFDDSGNEDPDFYIQTGQLTEQVMAPLTLDPANGDDIVITFFSIADGVYLRYPNDQGWSVYGNQTSALTNAEIQSRLVTGAPPAGVLLVEIFYNYPQFLKMPFFTAIVPDPIPVYVYAVMPLTAAEPPPTPTP